MRWVFHIWDSFYTNRKKKQKIIECTVQDVFLQTRIHIVNKKTGIACDVKLTAPPLFSFHHVNAYEQGGQEVIMDLVGYRDNKDVMDNLSIENLRRFGQPGFKPLPLPKLFRYVCPLQVPEVNICLLLVVQCGKLTAKFFCFCLIFPIFFKAYVYIFATLTNKVSPMWPFGYSECGLPPWKDCPPLVELVGWHILFWIISLKRNFI